VVTLLLGSAYREVRWSYVDSANNLTAAGDSRSWHEVVSDTLTKTAEYRPLLDLGIRVAYRMFGLSLATYKSIVLLNFALILAILVMMFRPVGRPRVIAAILALSVAVGLHTSQILFLFVPLNAYAASLLMVITVAWLALTPRLRRVEWLLLPFTFVALLWLEIGILIIPMVAVAWLMKAPGTTWRSVAASVLGFAIYATARWGYGPGIAQLTSPDTGLGFSGIGPAESSALFAHAPWLFWAHNVAVTLLTVLASEPRSGRFQFIESVLRGNVPVWMWLHVVSSIVTTLVVGGALAIIRSRPHRDRLIAAFGAVIILGGSALGFLYTRDRIGLPGGFGYAMLVYVAFSALLERNAPKWQSVPAATLVAVLVICWTIRTGETYLSIRDTAWDYHLEWTERWEQFAGSLPQTPLLARIRASALARRPPDVRRDPLWTYTLFRRRFAPVSEDP
jgi:hypothetical protein